MTIAGPRFRGAYPVLVTPFTPDEQVDLAGLDRLVDHLLREGVAGLVCFGLASEVYSLSDEERATVLGAVTRRVDGRVEVVAGVEHPSTFVLARRAAAWEAAGATALMAQPPAGASTVVAVEHLAALAGATSLDVIVQDAPSWTGVQLPVAALVDLARRHPTMRHVKVEAPPTGPKVSALRAAGIECIGGYGTLHLAEELDRGVRGTMPGCAHAGLVARALRAHEDGDAAGAAGLLRRLLPLHAFAMASLEVFIGVQKLHLHERGVIDHPVLRRPAAALEPVQREWARSLLAGLDDAEA